MTLSQLEYLIAVAEIGHFGKASEQMDVTQPTLSMMIKKLEEELDVILLDRSSKPIQPTQVGEAVIKQAKNVLAESNRIKELVREFSDELEGNYNLGVIPTIAPYLIPRLVDVLMRDYPALNLTIKETQTEYIIEDIKNGDLDGAILATPINDKEIEELPLFYEEFFAFGNFDTKGKEYLLPEDINTSELWLLEEGHCLRAQVVNLCELKNDEQDRLHYNSGSLETLIEIVRHHKGVTIVPELTAKKLQKEEQQLLGQFKPPAPYREMSLVIHRHSAKRKFVEAIQDVIEEIIPMEMRQLKQDSRIMNIYS